MWAQTQATNLAMNDHPEQAQIQVQDVTEELGGALRPNQRQEPELRS